MDQELNPSVKKILDYATGKSVITYDEVTVLVGQDFVNSPEWETVLQLLAKQNIQIIHIILDTLQEMLPEGDPRKELVR